MEVGRIVAIVIGVIAGAIVLSVGGYYLSVAIMQPPLDSGVPAITPDNNPYDPASTVAQNVPAQTPVMEVDDKRGDTLFPAPTYV